MAKAPMDKVLLTNIHIVILGAILLSTRHKSFADSSSSANPNHKVTSCIAGERSMLVSFKAGLSDPANLLSSWKGDDCCKWKGVHCSSRNNHIVKLDLPGRGCDISGIGVFDIDVVTQVLGGNISSSLLGLQHLQFLNLSCNSFDGVQIPKFLGSLHKLRSIDLSWSGFIGRIPPRLGNLSNLQYLNLGSYNAGTYSKDITRMSQLISLVYLDLSGVSLISVVHWLPVVNMLPSLKVLHLSGCNLRTSSASLQFSNLTSLRTLDLSDNSIDQFPDEIGNMTSIVKLDLSSNNFVGMIPSNLKNLCSLEEFTLDENNINGSITEFFLRLPSCSWNTLSYLSLYSSNLTGSLPTKLEPLRNLTDLYLNSNKLTGPVPLWIGELRKLIVLDLSSNNMDGFIHEGHLSNLESLELLLLSDNSIALTMNSTWVPPLDLTDIGLRSCLLGPKFPLWLRWLTHLDNLDISNTSISETVPDWFWITASTMDTLDMHNNQISGSLPSTLEFMRASQIDLSSNQFNGPIPLEFGAPMLKTFFLYDNSISGAIPPSFCKLQSLLRFDISENELTGPIPDCSVETYTQNMTSMSLVNLSLRNNKLSGEFPSFLQYCEQHVFLDLSHNHFSGILPTWIQKKLPYLGFLRLRSNMFYGHIPEELMKLVNLQYLDLAYNNITGRIPKSIVNCNGMTTTEVTDVNYNLAFDIAFGYAWSIGLKTYAESATVVTKGQESLYTGEIIYMVNLDLSCNNLIGDIPGEISALVALKNLNLSWNTFRGKIPENIGALAQVESLDISHNELSGKIPASLSALTLLSRLNLSYNNLTGEVPSGNQLQTLEDPEYIYIGNPGLCGPSLPQKCSQPKRIPATREHHEGITDVELLFIAMGSGYVMGIWVVFCIFLFKRKWRVNWYSVCDSLYDWVYVRVAVTWASCTREKTAEAETNC